MDEESRTSAEQARQHEQALTEQQQAYEDKIRALQEQLTTQGEKIVNAQRQQVAKQTKAASDTLILNEELTRILIDQQLAEAGWGADSQEITYQKGARPEKGTYRAIAEWPTSSKGEKGRADYVLFAGLTPIAVVEAKKENTNVAGKIGQAERYSKGFNVKAPLVGAWELTGRTIAWPTGDD